MDVARVCCVFRSKPWADSDVEQKVRLYRPPEGTPCVDFDHQWMLPFWDKSHNYANPFIPTDGGFIEGFTRYDKGARFIEVEAGEPCGRKEGWLNGFLVGTDPPLTWRSDRFSTCCRGEEDPPMNWQDSGMSEVAFSSTATDGAADETESHLEETSIGTELAGVLDESEVAFVSEAAEATGDDSASEAAFTSGGSESGPE